jgi:hypothetical protein
MLVSSELFSLSPASFLGSPSPLLGEILPEKTKGPAAKLKASQLS